MLTTTTTPVSQPSATQALKLYSRGQIIAATFFGTVLAGTHLVAANWRRLGQPRRALTAWSVGIFSFLVALGFMLAVPENASANALPLLLGIAVVERLGASQRLLVQERMNQGAVNPTDWAVGRLSLCYAAPFVALWLFGTYYGG